MKYLKAFGKYIFRIFLAIDQLANVLFGPLLNLLLETPPGARFGSEDETLSSVFGKNIRAGRCKACRVVCWVLDRIDPRGGSHCLQAIEDDETLNGN